MGGTSPTVCSALTRDLLEWLDTRPRTYAETLDAWRSTCPRLTIWEDALAAGLIDVEPVPGLGMSNARVTLSPHGLAALDTSRAARRAASDG